MAIDLTGILSNQDTEPAPAPAQTPAQPVSSQLAPAAAPASAPAQQPQSGGFWHGLLSTVAGGDTATGYSVDPTTGKTIETQTPVSTGDMFKRIFAATLTGLAGGVAANRAGEHGPLGALAGGFEAEQERQQQQDFIKRQQAEQQFKNQQSAQEAQDQHLLNRASTIKMNQDTAIASFQLAQNKVQLQEQTSKQIQSLANLVRSVPGAQDKGTFASFNDFLDSIKDPNERQQMIRAHLDGELQVTPSVGVDDKGNPFVNGAHIAYIPKSAMEQPTSDPVTVTVASGVDENGQQTYQKHTFEPGQLTVGEALELQGKGVVGAITPLAKYNQQQQNARSYADIAERKREADQRNATELKKIDSDNNSQNIDTAARMLLNSDLDPASLGRSKNRFNVITRAEQLAQSMGQNFHYDATRYKEKWETIRKYTTGKGSTQMQGGDMAIQHINDYVALLKRLPQGNSDLPTLNRLSLAVAHQMGLPQGTSLETLAQQIATERAKMAKGGEPGETEIKTYTEPLIHGGVSEMRAAAMETANIIQRNFGTFADELNRQVPGYQTRTDLPRLSRGATEAMKNLGLNNPFQFAGQQTASAQYSQTATGPNGVKIGSNDGGNTWFDVSTGKAFKQ